MGKKITRPRLQALPPASKMEGYLQWLAPERTFEGKRVLEIGADEWLYSKLIVERYHAKHATALNVSEDELPHAFLRGNDPRIRFVVGDCYDLPFQTGSFEVVFGSLVLCACRRVEDALREIHRVLTDGGLYLGIEPSLRNPVHLYRMLFLRGHPDEFLLSSARIRKAFAQTGFELRLHLLAPRFPFLPRLGLATCVGIWAQRK